MMTWEIIKIDDISWISDLRMCMEDAVLLEMDMISFKVEGMRKDLKYREKRCSSACVSV